MRGARHIEDRVHSDRDAVLFLWRSHNKANFHLHGDATEDPEHPKLQFPSVLQCPACHVATDNGTDSFDEDAVFRFLSAMYAADRFMHDAEPLVDLTTERTSGITSILRVLGGHRASVDRFVVITRLDISLCLAFYFICIILLVIFYMKFCRRCRLKPVVSYA